MGGIMAVYDKAGNTAVDRIRAFLSNNESGIILNVEEEIMLNRMIYANALLTERKFTTKRVAEMVKEKFGCSIHTARLDINRAYSLFVQVTQDYQRFTLYHHIEAMKAKAVAWENDKSMAKLLPGLYREITYAIAQLPVELQQPDIPQPIILLNVVSKADSSTLQAMRKEADDLIELEKNWALEETDFEDVS